MNYTPILEGILFLVGSDGIDFDQLKSILEIDDDKLNEALENLKQEYEKETRGIKIENLGNKLKLTTKKEHKAYYQKLCDIEKEEGLTQSALETLAIIAYNQPITRSEIDQARGVVSSHILRRLLLKDLITVVGKSDLPGKPNLYGTTDNFLDYFGLSSIDDLPELKQNKEEKNDDEKELFNSKYTEE